MPGKDRSVVLVDRLAADETLFELEPQYEKNELTTVEVHKYFFIRHVATGRYLHALQGLDTDADGEEDEWAQGLTLVASLTKHNEDGASLGLELQSVHRLPDC